MKVKAMGGKGGFCTSTSRQRNSQFYCVHHVDRCFKKIDIIFLFKILIINLSKK